MAILFYEQSNRIKQSLSDIENRINVIRNEGQARTIPKIK